MAVILLPLTLLALIVNIGIRSNNGIKSTALMGMLVFSGIVVLGTEVMSILQTLNYQSVIVFWSTVLLLNTLFLIFQKKRITPFISQQLLALKYNFTKINRTGKAMLVFIAFMLLVLLVQGIIYPPNNWDSMTYHMARIPNWISHQSLEHYPTHIYRQIYQPPFSEYVIMQTNILNQADYFSNTVQWFYLVFSLVAISSLASIIGLNKYYQIVAVLLAITVPEVLLQGSSTQNDIVVSFFILSAIYFAYQSVQKLSFQNYFFFGLSVGLAMLTKGTAYIYLLPVLILFGIAVSMEFFKTKKIGYIGYSIVAGILCLSLNTGHFYRNYTFNQNILGTDEGESKMYANETMSPLLLLSGVVKNAGLHVGSIADESVYSFHELLGIRTNTPGNNFGNMPYYTEDGKFNHEDTAPNRVHLFIILIACTVWIFYLIRKKKNTTVLYLALILALQILVFSYYLKWQPWHTRLHTPVFILFSVFVAYVISQSSKYLKWFFAFLLVGASVYGLVITPVNYSRPLVVNPNTSEITITHSRAEKYFTNKPYLYPEYNTLIQLINTQKLENIGLILGGDDWEYPLFAPFYGKNVNPVHINVTNATQTLSVPKNDIDCIISTTLKDSTFTYQDRVYRNLTPSHSQIRLYR